MPTPSLLRLITQEAARETGPRTGRLLAYRSDGVMVVQLLDEGRQVQAHAATDEPIEPGSKCWVMRAADGSYVVYGSQR